MSPAKQPHTEMGNERSLHVLYLTWGEVVVHNGIFDNQVLEQLKLLQKVDPTLSLMLCSGMPLVNQPLLKRSQAFYQDLQRIKSQLHAVDIQFVFRWIPAVARWFHSQPHHFRFYTIGQLHYLSRLVAANDIDIIHCRGYHATRLALLAKECYQLTAAVIFDTRGLFPEEGVFAGHFAQESQAYARWKREEKWLLDRADAVVNVSDTFTTHVRTLTDNPRVETIYTSVNLDLFQRPTTVAEIADTAGTIPQERNGRQQLGIDNETRVLVYLGSIGIDHGWHRLDNLIALYQAFRQAFPKTKLLIITRSAHAALRAVLEQIYADDKEYLLVAGNSPQETAGYLQAADYAALPYRAVNSPLEELIGYTMVASKTGEYFGLGLPLLVNRAVGAASQLVAKHKIGCVYTAGEEAALIEPLRQFDADHATASARAVRVAHDYFSAIGNAKRYLALYQQLCFEQ